MKRLAFALLLAACSSNGSKTSQTSSSSQSGSADQTTGSDTGPTSPGSGASAVTARGEKCGEHDACPPGLECVKYYGIAGPRGPQFTSCETKCDAGQACPSGTKCTTIADGPGQVCR